MAIRFVTIATAPSGHYHVVSKIFPRVEDGGVTFEVLENLEQITASKHIADIAAKKFGTAQNCRYVPENTPVMTVFSKENSEYLAFEIQPDGGIALVGPIALGDEISNEARKRGLPLVLPR